MRKLLYNIIGIAGLACGVASCSDFLEIKPQHEIILEDFWNEKADVDNVVAGCYSGLQSEDVMRRMMVWGEFRSENVMPGINVNSDINLENVLKENITAINAYTTWDGFYSVINRCNTVIKYAPGVAAEDPGYTPSELNATIAEVSALRDLCYFYLIRTFRDVPYSTEAYTDDDQVMDLPATPFYAVLDSLINDLERVKGDAVVYYPETKPLYQTARITRDAIYAMLCEMYLWKQDYQNCIKYADLVIESKKEQEKSYRSSLFGNQQDAIERLNGYPLELNSSSTSSNMYGSAYEAIFVDGSSKETIFELSFNDNPQSSGMLSNQAVCAFYGHASVAKGLVAPSTALITDAGKTSGRTIFDDRNKALDARIHEAYDQSEGCFKYVYRGIYITPQGTDKVSLLYSSRFVDKDNGSKWIIYRLPDIMLMKAEALCQQMHEGNDADDIAFNTPLREQIFNLVNAVNKRSVCQSVLADTLRATDYNTKNLLQTLVLRERQREFLFEGKRWYDLVRRSMRDGNTEALLQAVSSREVSNSEYVKNFFKKMDAIFWPYNNEETKVNLNLVQNPAFDSGENSSYEKTK